MLASFVIVFREMLEAGLIIGVVLAAAQGVAGRLAAVFGGVAVGAAGAVIVALSADVLAQALSGIGQEVFTASVLGAAVLMLGWHNVWMARHGRELSAQLSGVGHAVQRGDKPLIVLAAIVAIAVLREGSEVVLFLYGIAASAHEPAASLLSGGALGLGAAALISALLYRGLVAIPLKHLFSVTNVLIALLAAGMAGQAAAVLASVDIIPALGDPLWNTSFLLSDGSWLGRALHALVGYSARPPGVQVLVYLVTLALLISLKRLVAGGEAKRRRSVSAAARSEAH